MTTNSKLFLRETKCRNRDEASDLGKFKMLPRDPYEILGIKKKPSNLPAPPANPKSGEKT